MEEPASFFTTESVEPANQVTYWVRTFEGNVGHSQLSDTDTTYPCWGMDNLFYFYFHNYEILVRSDIAPVFKSRKIPIPVVGAYRIALNPFPAILYSFLLI